MKPIRVLVVDDDRNARLALCELLRDEGYEVVAAGDGVEALERVQSFHPDVVLSDVKMPRMNGFKLRETLAARAAVPVVVLMSVYPPGRADELFLAKPLDLTRLYEAVASATRRA